MIFKRMFFGLVAAGLLGAASACWCIDAPKDAPPQTADVSKTYTESISGTLVKFDMVKIPAGTVEVADPAKPETKKKIEVKSLWVEKTEATWDMYDVFVFRLDEPQSPAPGGADAVSHPSKPYGMADRSWGHQGYPVIDESYLGADSFCKWLSLKTGKKYRLPTEAEWQYACTANQQLPSKDELPKCACFNAEKTEPVGKKKPNAFGLYDMLGNVGQWAVDLSGKPVVCGSSHDDWAQDVNATRRRYWDASWQANDPQNPKSKWWLSDGTFVGFRVVREE